jgi:hypothetical protein
VPATALAAPTPIAVERRPATAVVPQASAPIQRSVHAALHVGRKVGRLPLVARRVAHVPPARVVQNAAAKVDAAGQAMREAMRQAAEQAAQRWSAAAAQQRSAWEQAAQEYASRWRAAQQSPTTSPTTQQQQQPARQHWSGSWQAAWQAYGQRPSSGGDAATPGTP